jgi:Putative zinc-finger
MDCSDLRNDLLDVLYGEASADTRRSVEAHATSCAACRDEIQALHAVRSDLQGWKAPSARPLLPRRPSYRLPAVLAAAAALLVATGAGFGLSGSELRIEEGGVALRLGRGPSEQVLERALAAQEARHRQEILALRAELSGGVRPATLSAADDPLLERVAEMIRESESRQAERLTANLASLGERTESRRRYDLARIGAGLAYLDGKNGQHLSRTTELMGYMLEASEKRGER